MLKETSVFRCYNILSPHQGICRAEKAKQRTEGIGVETVRTHGLVEQLLRGHMYISIHLKMYIYMYLYIHIYTYR